MKNNAFLEIINNGQELVYTDFWDSEAALRDKFFLSFNAGALRILIPPRLECCIPEMCRCQRVELVRMDFPDRIIYEVTFVDGSPNPCRLLTLIEASDRLLPIAENGKALDVSVWVRGKDGGKPACRLRRPGRYTIA